MEVSIHIKGFVKVDYQIVPIFSERIIGVTWSCGNRWRIVVETLYWSITKRAERSFLFNNRLIVCCCTSFRECFNQTEIYRRHWLSSNPWMHNYFCFKITKQSFLLLYSLNGFLRMLKIIDNQPLKYIKIWFWNLIKCVSVRNDMVCLHLDSHYESK